MKADELIEAAEDAAKAFEAPEQSLDFVATSVHCFLESPGLNAPRMRRYHRDEAEVQRELSGLVAFIRAIHQQVAGHRQFRQRIQQCCGPTVHIQSLWDIRLGPAQEGEELVMSVPRLAIGEYLAIEHIQSSEQHSRPLATP